MAGAADDVIELSGVKGGLIVHLGCGDGKRTAALHKTDAFLVHGLDRDAAKIETARNRLIEQRVHGKVTVEHWTKKTLPFIDNLVNLIVVEDAGGIPMTEVMRVLCPNGVLLTKEEDSWKRTVKPRPKEIDEWTHFLHDASNNAVAQDTKVGPPKHLQWKAGPEYTRDHDALASVSAVTTSNGRLFYIIDEAPTSLIHRPSGWKLIARDAFNGTLLWKRDIPVWITQLANFRAGPAQMPRRLVSIKDRVFVTLGLNAPVQVLDAATGRTLLTFAGSEKTEEIILNNNVLLAAVGDPDLLTDAATDVEVFSQIEAKNVKPVKRKIIAYDSTSGKEMWRAEDDGTAGYMGLSLTSGKDRVFYLNGDELRCRDLDSGKEQWRSAFKFKGRFFLNYTPTVVTCDDVVLCLTYHRLCAFSIADGRKLWERKGAVGFASAGDLFVLDGIVWSIPMTRFGVKTIWQKSDFLGEAGREFWGMDLHTGEVRKRVSRGILPGVHHHRCYRNKASTNYLIYGQGGLEFMDLKGDNHSGNLWTRGVCQYGVMPANGYMYIPPHPCQCYSQNMLTGFNVLSSSSSAGKVVLHPVQEKGPAFSLAMEKNGPPTQAGLQPTMIWQPPVKLGRVDEWPMYRADLTRSSSTAQKISESPEKAWQVKLGADLTGAVVAGNRMVVCSKAEQVVYCLDATSGKPLWQRATPAKVDSPPVLVNGLCVFGSVDGSVYCLNAEDGALRWRFRIGSVERRTVVDNKLESIWPVHGSVLVQNDTVYFASGRSSHLDGGIRLFAVDLASGEIKNHIPLDAEAPGDQKAYLNVDLLVSDGVLINMGLAQFDEELNLQPVSKLTTLISDTGFLSDSWFHRENWVLGGVEDRVSTTHRIKMQVQGDTGKDSLGKLLAFNDTTVYGVKNPYSHQKYSKEINIPTHTGHRHQKYSRYDPSWFPVGCRVFASENVKPDEPQKKIKYPGMPAKAHARPEVWGVDMNFQPRTIVLSGGTLILAGWLDAVAIKPKTGLALNPENPDPRDCVLRVLSIEDGKMLSECRIPGEPAYDGMAIAYDKIYLPLKNGTVICLK